MDESIAAACSWKNKEIGNVTGVICDKALESPLLPAAVFSRDLYIKGDRANESSSRRVTERPQTPWKAPSGLGDRGRVSESNGTGCITFHFEAACVLERHLHQVNRQRIAHIDDIKAWRLAEKTQVSRQRIASACRNDCDPLPLPVETIENFKKRPITSDRREAAKPRGLHRKLCPMSGMLRENGLLYQVSQITQDIRKTCPRPTPSRVAIHDGQPATHFEMIPRLESAQ